MPSTAAARPSPQEDAGQAKSSFSSSSSLSPAHKMNMMMESPTSRSMAALSQSVSPVQYAPSPPPKKSVAADASDAHHKYHGDDDESTSCCSSTGLHMQKQQQNKKTTATKSKISKKDLALSSTSFSVSSAWHQKNKTTKTNNNNTNKSITKRSVINAPKNKRTGHLVVGSSSSRNGQTTTNGSKTGRKTPTSRAVAKSSSSFKNTKAAKEAPNNGCGGDDDEGSGNVNYPFCKLCVYEDQMARDGGRRPRGGVPTVHHSWCPENPTSERGENRLRIILTGRNELKCQGCEKEYKTGKVVPSKGHNMACRQNTKKILSQLKKEYDHQSKKKQQPKKQSKTGTSTAATTTSTNQTKRKRGQDDDSEDDSDAVDCNSSVDSQDEISEYKPSKKGSAIHTIRPTKKRQTTTTTTMSTTSKTKKKQLTTKRKPGSKNSSRVHGSKLPETPYQPSKSSLETDEESDEEEEEIQLIPKWVPVDDNPWGPEGYVFGDVVLFGQQDSGMWHPETALPSSRYVTEPFQADSKYRITHFTPEEGLSVLSLRRDPLGNRPWGFEVTRDEFGHACLVSSVDVASPASAATLVGGSWSWSTDAPSPHGLNQNDMILSINGQQIGGMTVETLAVELQSTGSHLQLVVSRYKHRKEAAERFAKAEREVLDTMDAAARDDRLLGWKEIGNGPLEARKIDYSKENELTNNADNNNQNDLSSESPILDEHERPGDIQATSRNYDEESREKSFEIFKTTECVEIAEDGVDSSVSNESSLAHAKDGCVCGKIHSSQSHHLFWVQCEGCATWFDVAEECVGFSKAEVESIQSFHCRACKPLECESTAGFLEGKGTKIQGDKKTKARTLDDDVDDEDEMNHGTRRATATSCPRDDSSPLANSRKIGDVSTAKELLTSKGWKLVGSFWWYSPDGKTKKRGLKAAIAHLDNNDMGVTGHVSPSAIDTCANSKKTMKEELIEHGWEIEDRTKQNYLCRSPGGTKYRGIANAHSRMKETNRGRSMGSLQVQNIDEADNLDESNTAKQHKPASRSRKKRTVSEAVSSSSRQSPRIARKNLAPGARGPSETDKKEEQGPQKDFNGFDVGDLVEVEQHSWPGKNVYAGRAKIIERYEDENGNRMYSIKYTILKITIHNVGETYISPAVEY
jgi:PDZ domain